MLNTIESYTHEATQYAVAVYQKDIARARSHKEYFMKMRSLEVHVDQVMLTKLLNDTYRDYMQSHRRLF